MPERRYEEDEDGNGLVACDDGTCKAKVDPNPKDPTELLVALEHWRDHGVSYGCSHRR